MQAGCATGRYYGDLLRDEDAFVRDEITHFGDLVHDYLIVNYQELGR